MKRKDYKKPTTYIVKMRHQSQLLISSPGEAGVQNFDWHNEDEE